MNLKNLTPEQCVEIANLAVPNLNWEYTNKYEGTWDGFDLIVNEPDEDGFFEHIFQISFDGTLRYFHNLDEFSVGNHLTHSYIKNL